MSSSGLPGQAPILSVSEFVAVFNQSLEIVFPSVAIVGELANLRISKNKWIYFDLKDDLATVKFFGTVYALPGPLEDGMLLEVRGMPRLHHQYGFSVNVASIQPVGEGSIKRAAQLLEAKLRAEGLFEAARKRLLPYPPKNIGLITSQQAAAYEDFIKVINGRWAGMQIEHADVQVQGEPASSQIIQAIEHFNQMAVPPEVLIITRGGGSAEDLAAFNNELLVRAIAGSRIPTLIAVGHEIDITLAELAADVRASTPSNAAELLVPDKHHEQARLVNLQSSLSQGLTNWVSRAGTQLNQQALQMNQFVTQYLDSQNLSLGTKSNLLIALSPASALKRGYVIVRRISSNKVIKSAIKVRPKDAVSLQWHDGQAGATISSIKS